MTGERKGMLRFALTRPRVVATAKRRVDRGRKLRNAGTVFDPRQRGDALPTVRKLAVSAWLGVAGMLLLAAGLIRGVLPPDDPLGSWAFGLLEVGLFSLLLALLPLMGVRPRALAGLGLAMVLVLSVLMLAETTFRWVGWDFRGQEAAWRRLPPFTREARTPTGTVFFRRDGPEAWTGAVIRASLEWRGQAVPSVYRDEPTLVVRYDAQGFRNEAGWTDWEVAVAGDSFTELGFLPYEALFTTLMGSGVGAGAMLTDHEPGRIPGGGTPPSTAGETPAATEAWFMESSLEWRVRNLGVSGTGPYTQLHYLREYGDAPSLRQVLIVFFEGNDLEDMELELEAMNRWEATRERPRRDVVPQSSVLMALGDIWAGVHGDRGGARSAPRVYTFRSAAGPVPVHLTEVPPQRRRLPEDGMERMDRFLGEYQSWTQAQGVEAWLAYMPCKARVLHGRIEGDDPRSLHPGPWWSEELPGLVREACHRQGIRWVDLTPPSDGGVERSGRVGVQSAVRGASQCAGVGDRGG
jgi:hypothetical protein